MSRPRVGTEGDERGVGLARQTDNAWGDISEEELAARNRAVAQANTRAGALDIVIDTMAKRLQNDKAPPDRQRGLDATRSAKTRAAWAEWHRHQAERHRRTLTDLVAHHLEQAERLMR
jgi:hypothetical protein